jgi:hypothetical protein
MNERKLADAIREIDEQRRAEAASLGNGHDGDATAIAAHEVEDAIVNSGGKDLLLRSVDKVTTNWIIALQETRRHSEITETMLVQHASRVKGDIETLFTLASISIGDAKRTHDADAQIQTMLTNARST